MDKKSKTKKTKKPKNQKTKKSKNQKAKKPFYFWLFIKQRS